MDKKQPGNMIAPERLGGPVTPERDQALQSAFIESLQTVRKDHIGSMPDLSGGINHFGRISRGLGDNFTDGLYLSQAFMSGCREVGHQLPDRFSFQQQKMLRLGRENSYQQVFFGTLDQSWFSDHQTRDTTHIAIKPYEGLGKRDTAFHEAAMYQYLAAVGLSTFELIGVLQSPSDQRGGTVYLMTKFQPVNTMDNIHWQNLSLENRWSTAQIGVQALAELHSRLIFHGDFELKNAAFNELKGSTFIIDPQLAVSAAVMRHPSAEVGQLGKLMSVDFGDYCRSLSASIWKGLPDEQKPQTDIESFDTMFRHVYLPYRERIVHLDNDSVRNVLLQAWDIVVDQKARQASGEW